jgi:isochorismate pyruvate lyase
LNITLDCKSIEEVRSNIDRIDRQIVTLLAERGSYVKQAARFKKSTNDVKSPQRVEQVIANISVLAKELGANPSVTEQVYRAMISGFINAELAEHAALISNSIKH